MSSERLSRAEGRLSDTAKQTMWQFVIFMAGVGGFIAGLLNYQRNDLDKRFDEVNRRIEQGQIDLGTRLERIERNLDELNKGTAEQALIVSSRSSFQVTLFILVSAPF
jgi:hypothetical protein